MNDVSGRAVLQIGEGEALEVFPLTLLLGVETTPRAGPVPVVVLRTPKGGVGLAVDELLGLHEIVIMTRGARGLFLGSGSGRAFLDPAGTVVLFVRVPSRFRRGGHN